MRFVQRIAPNVVNERKDQRVDLKCATKQLGKGGFALLMEDEICAAPQGVRNAPIKADIALHMAEGSDVVCSSVPRRPRSAGSALPMEEANVVNKLIVRAPLNKMGIASNTTRKICEKFDRLFNKSFPFAPKRFQTCGTCPTEEGALEISNSPKKCKLMSNVNVQRRCIHYREQL